jgi:hypothetical protein
MPRCAATELNESRWQCLVLFSSMIRREVRRAGAETRSGQFTETTSGSTVISTDLNAGVFESGSTSCGTSTLDSG